MAKKHSINTDGSTIIMPEYSLKLYISGHTVASIEDISRLKRLSEEEFKGLYDFTVTDILETPESLEAEKIVRESPLFEKLPTEVRQIIEDLQDTRKILVGLEIISNKNS